MALTSAGRAVLASLVRHNRRAIVFDGWVDYLPTPDNRSSFKPLASTLARLERDGYLRRVEGESAGTYYEPTPAGRAAVEPDHADN